MIVSISRRQWQLPRKHAGRHPSRLRCGGGWYRVDVQVVLTIMPLFMIRLDRTTNGVGRVNQQPQSYLAQLDAGKGQGIPTLQQVFDTIGTQTDITLELKHTFSLDKFVDYIEDHIQRGVITREQLLLSFDHHQLL